MDRVQIFSEAPVAHVRTRKARVAQSLRNWDGENHQLELAVVALRFIVRGLPGHGDATDSVGAGAGGAVLCFLTGWDDIQTLHEILKTDPEFGDRSKFLLLPLHSALPTSSQRQIFARPSAGVRKGLIISEISFWSYTILSRTILVNSRTIYCSGRGILTVL